MRDEIDRKGKQRKRVKWQLSEDCETMRAWAWWFVAALAAACGRELDPAACASRFDVQRNKIIRTDESRMMGALYISELDVGSRDECLRLCCETELCNVFVYEEKIAGNCYVFNCGPPEDFRCKFTKHSNYSSGVMTISRLMAERQDQERLAQHEKELVSLRAHTSTTPKSPIAPSPTVPPAPAALSPQPIPRRCSRYQFECHSGGECIAVYNACDGVPQCADGSDEAPELGCPAAAPAPHTQPPPVYTPPKTQDSVVEAGLSSELVAESASAQDTRAAHWPHRLVQAQPPIQYTDNGPSSHIFSHKGGLIQEADNPPMSPNVVQSYPPFEAPWQRRPWAQPSGVENMGGMPRGYGGSANGGYSRYREWGEVPDPQRAWPVPQPQPREPVPDMPMYMPPKTMPEQPMVYSSQQETLRDSPKKGFDLIPKRHPAEMSATESSVDISKATSNELVDVSVKKIKETATENKTKKKDMKPETPSPIKNAAVEVTKKPETSVHSLQHDRYEMTPDDHDGLSEHPPAAVLLLVLGILMTTVMAVMLGCRLRMARRRMRRGKSPFAHDADYLVNGMYL